MNLNFFPAKIKPILAYDPSTRYLLISKLKGVPGCIQSFELSNQKLIYKEKTVVIPFNRISRTTKSGPPSIVPMVQFFQISGNYMVCVCIEHSTIKTIGYECNQNINGVSTLELYLHSSLKCVVPSPHGSSASICAILLKDQLLISLSNDDQAFRVWDVTKKEVSLKCRYKVTSPIGLGKFTGACALSQDNSTLSIAYESYVALWHVSNGALLKTIVTDDHCKYLYFSLNNHLLLVSKRGFLCSNIFTSSENWVWKLDPKNSSELVDSFFLIEDNFIFVAIYHQQHNISEIIPFDALSGNIISLPYEDNQNNCSYFAVHGKVQQILIIHDNKDHKQLIAIDDYENFTIFSLQESTSTKQTSLTIIHQSKSTPTLPGNKLIVEQTEQKTHQQSVIHSSVPITTYDYTDFVEKSLKRRKLNR